MDNKQLTALYFTGRYKAQSESLGSSVMNYFIIGVNYFYPI